jgi:hypothetical protein
MRTFLPLRESETQSRKKHSISIRESGTTLASYRDTKRDLHGELPGGRKDERVRVGAPHDAADGGEAEPGLFCCDALAGSVRTTTSPHVLPHGSSVAHPAVPQAPSWLDLIGHRRVNKTRIFKRVRNEFVPSSWFPREQTSSNSSRSTQNCIWVYS